MVSGLMDEMHIQVLLQVKNQQNKDEASFHTHSKSTINIMRIVIFLLQFFFFSSSLLCDTWEYGISIKRLISVNPYILYSTSYMCNYHNFARNFCQNNSELICPVAKSHDTYSPPPFTSVINTQYKWKYSSKSSLCVQQVPFQLKFRDFFLSPGWFMNIKILK